jgi:type I restriction-modification system DNA methylase subunit
MSSKRLSIVTDLFEIRSRTAFSANDITIWLVDTFRELFGITATQVRTEVIIKGKSRGRADLVVQDSIGIETKHNLTDELDDAEIQVERILEKLEKEGDISPVGIATDGQRWRFYVLAEGKPFQFHSFELKEASGVSELESNLLLGLTALRYQKDRPDPTAQKVAEAFRPSGPAFNEARTRLIAQMRYLVDKDPVQFTSKFVPWFELFSYVYNNFQGRCASWAGYSSDLDPIASKLKKLETLNSLPKPVLEGAIELFVRHTYLALLAKTLSALVTLGEDGVAKSLLSDQTNVNIITGRAIAQAGIFISDENDFFVWPSKGPNPQKIVGALTRPLQRFSDNYTDDIFRHLYEDVVDADTRHELGEFFTPKWIAQLIVRHTIMTPSDNVLDPACGSGTFLVVALRKKAQLLSSKKRLQSSDFAKLLDEVSGIDVNPLSVTLARTNLYLATTAILKGYQQPPEIRPRVYVADTFILPRFTDKEQKQLEQTGLESAVIYAPVTPKVTVPILPRLTPDEMNEWVEFMGKHLEDHSTQVPFDKFDDDISEFLQALEATMKDLRKRYGNNLWKFVLRNYSIPPLLRRKFDVVIGNPPWLTFREAKESIKEMIEGIAVQYKVQSSVQTKTSFNLAVTFFLASCNFVKPGGKIGFVFPLSAIASPAHLPFIDLLLDKKLFSLLKVYDLQDVSPHPFPHDLPSCIMIAEVKR